MNTRVVVFLLALLVPIAAQTPQQFDILIEERARARWHRQSLVRADIGITGDRIRAMGNLSAATAKTVIDAKDRFVTPGFIDVHSHAGGGLATEGLKHGSRCWRRA